MSFFNLGYKNRLSVFSSEKGVVGWAMCRGHIFKPSVDRGAIILTMTSSLTPARRRRGAAGRVGGNLRTKSRYE